MLPEHKSESDLTLLRLPDTRQAAVFDTGYHSSVLPHVYRYAVPSHWYHQHGVRR